MRYITLVMLILSVGCSRTDDLKAPDIANLSPDPIDLTITIKSDSIPARTDTSAQVTLTATSALLKKYTEATLTISTPGRFSNNTSTIKTTFNNAGQAIVYALSEQEGITYVTATIGKIVKTATLKFYKVKTDSLKLTLTADNIVADNYSHAEIVATTTAAGLSGAARQITFTADKGIFSNGAAIYQVTAAANDITKAYLKYNKAEPVRVSVTIGSYSRELFINFVPAWPSQVSIEPDSTVLQASLKAKSKVKVRLFRSPGTVSEGQLVSFYDSTETGGHIGTFFNNSGMTNAQGEATAEYWLQDVNYKGFVYIKGLVQTTNGPVIGVNRILIQ